MSRLESRSTGRFASSRLVMRKLFAGSTDYTANGYGIRGLRATENRRCLDSQRTWSADGAETLA